MCGKDHLPDDKILGLSKLGEFADDKIEVSEMKEYVMDTIENIFGKGENAAYQYFLLFPQSFPFLFSKIFSGICRRQYHYDFNTLF